MINKIVKLKNFEISNNKKISLISGPCQLETEQHAMDMAGKIKEIAKKLDIGFIYKTSFDKANRTSLKGKRGAGLETSLPVFDRIRKELDIPVLTDVHNIDQCSVVSDHVDIIQIPAFLSRQTDLIEAACQTSLPLNIKKGQFLAPSDMLNILKKCSYFNNDKVMICERGTSFGYNNLVVDMLGVNELKKTQQPVIFDVTHSLQRPGGLGDKADGRGSSVLELARSGMSLGLAGLFLETHPNPEKALCDGPCALKLDDLDDFLYQIKSLDDLIKSFV